MALKDPEARRAYDVAYWAARREKKREYDMHYNASSAGILRTERGYQKSVRGNYGIQN